MPKIDIAAVPERKGTGYPPPFDAPCAGRIRQRLGDAVPQVQRRTVKVILPLYRTYKGTRTRTRATFV